MTDGEAEMGSPDTDDPDLLAAIFDRLLDSANEGRLDPLRGPVSGGQRSGPHTHTKQDPPTS